MIRPTGKRSWSRRMMPWDKKNSKFPNSQVLKFVKATATLLYVMAMRTSREAFLRRSRWSPRSARCCLKNLSIVFDWQKTLSMWSALVKCIQCLSLQVYWVPKNPPSKFILQDYEVWPKRKEKLFLKNSLRILLYILGLLEIK